MTSMGERATKASPRELEHYTRLVVEACRQANVDPVFFAAILWVEAKFQHNLKSPAGACGLAQVMPTRRHSCRDLMEPAYAVRAGVANLAHWMRLHGGDALCHYNGGNVCGGGARAFERRVWAVYETMRRRVADKLRAVDET
jgi:soluble lytic murein transglycosylase-like protein